MLNVFICDDSQHYLTKLKNSIQNCIDFEELNMRIVCEASAPAQVLDYLSKNNPAATGIYFLDIDLSTDIDGFQLAEAIRQHDPRGFIIFITAVADSILLTFKYKIEAMDYIVKSEPDLDARIKECLRKAYARCTSSSALSQQRFVFKSNEAGSTFVDYSDIFYFEASVVPKNVIMYHTGGMYQFRGSLSNILKTLDTSFYRVHKSYIINCNKIKSVDSKTAEIEFDMHAKITLSNRLIRKLTKYLKKQHKV